MILPLVAVAFSSALFVAAQTLDDPLEISIDISIDLPSPTLSPVSSDNPLPTSNETVSLELPTVSLPSLSIPTELPSLSVPSISLDPTDLPSLSVPSISLDTSVIQHPTSVNFSLPIPIPTGSHHNFSLPHFSIPHFSIPRSFAIPTPSFVTHSRSSKTSSPTSVPSATSTAGVGSSCNNRANGLCDAAIWFGSNCCPSDYSCESQNRLYSLCKLVSAVGNSTQNDGAPGNFSQSVSATSTSSTADSTSTHTCAIGDKCNGFGFRARSCCPAGSSCRAIYGRHFVNHRECVADNSSSISAEPTSSSTPGSSLTAEPTDEPSSAISTAIPSSTGTGGFFGNGGRNRGGRFPFKML